MKPMKITLSFVASLHVEASEKTIQRAIELEKLDGYLLDNDETWEDLSEENRLEILGNYLLSVVGVSAGYSDYSGTNALISFQGSDGKCKSASFEVPDLPEEFRFDAEGSTRIWSLKNIEI